MQPVFCIRPDYVDLPLDGRVIRRHHAEENDFNRGAAFSLDNLFIGKPDRSSDMSESLPGDPILQRTSEGHLLSDLLLGISKGYSRCSL